MSEAAKQSIKDRVLARIENGEVKVRPKAIAVLKACALIAVVVLSLGISAFLFNFLFFFLRINSFARPGVIGLSFDVARFLLMFPWRLLALDFALLVLAEILLRQFRFAYRRPVLLSIFILLSLTLALGLAIDRATHFNESMEGRARFGRLPPPIGDMYRHARFIQIVQ